MPTALTPFLKGQCEALLLLMMYHEHITVRGPAVSQMKVEQGGKSFCKIKAPGYTRERQSVTSMFLLGFFKPLKNFLVAVFLEFMIHFNMEPQINTI